VALVSESKAEAAIYWVAQCPQAPAGWHQDHSQHEIDLAAIRQGWSVAVCQLIGKIEDRVGILFLPRVRLLFPNH